ncbi:MAG: hypothetical protein AAB870_01480 [Patescibacteria group bacterium]
MEAVYYYDKATSSCPVKLYLEQYRIKNSDTEKAKQKKLHLLASIAQKIEYIAQKNGLPIPPIAAPLHGYSFFEIKTRKDKNILIRIHYFRSSDKIVLLNAFEKSDSYSTEKERRAINHEQEMTQRYQRLFINDSTLYEKYQ